MGTFIPSAIVNTAPSAEHDDTPKVELSARGFLSNPWVAEPDIERDAPTSAANNTLGKRMLRIITMVLKGISDIEPIPIIFNNIRTVSLMDTSTLPTDTHSRSTAINAGINIMYMNFLYDFFCFSIVFNNNASSPINLLC